MSDRITWCDAQAVCFWLAFYQGRTLQALDIARELLCRAENTGNRQHQAWALRFIAVCELREGHPAEAAWRLDEAFQRLRDITALNERIPVLGLLALARLQLGERPVAQQRLRESLALLGRSYRPTNHAMLEAYSALTEVALDGWRLEPRSGDRRREAEDCLQALRRYRATFPIGEPQYQLWLGRYREIAGREHLARGSLARAVGAARQLGMAWDSAAPGQGDLSHQLGHAINGKLPSEGCNGHGRIVHMSADAP